jgi:flagellar biosynthesis protein FlhF
MRIKKYIADSAKEALLQVKEELGPKAVILKTQRRPGKSFLGILGKGQVEVTAALDEELFIKPKQAQNDKKSVNPVDDLKLYSRNGSVANLASLQKSDESSPRNFSDEKFRLAEIHEDVEEVKSVLRGLADHIRHQNMPPLPEQVTGVFAHLIKQEISDETALKICLKLQGVLGESDYEHGKKIQEKAIEIMASFINASGPFFLQDRRASRIMFVGPTGSGKTTTLAKLAAQYGILQRKRVRIITADTYRIAAIEQLRTFAEISDIPMEVAFTPEEMRRLVTKMTASSDLVLIDTAGRSQHNKEHMEDLKSMVEAAEPDELHLVLSATTKQSDLLDNTDRYRLLGVNRYLFTKLDETRCYGAIYNLLSESKAVFSYMTNGQSVPDDIEEGNAVRLAKMIMAGE